MTSDERAKLASGRGSSTLFFGDSYTAGQYQSDFRQSWPYIAARALEVRPLVVGRPGAGFVGGGCTKAPFDVATPTAGDFQTVIVQGGLNDELKDPAIVAAAARRVLASWPGRRVVLVGPPVVPARSAEMAARMDETLKAAADQAHVQYISAFGWMCADDFLSDGMHLTTEGHRRFGEHIARAMNAGTDPSRQGNCPDSSLGSKG